MTELHSSEAPTRQFQLSPQQVRFFRTFGYLRLPGLFRDDIVRIQDAFEQVFATQGDGAVHHDLQEEGFRDAFADSDRIDSYHHLNFGGHRAIIPDFVERHPVLEALLHDHRTLGIVEDLVGPHHRYMGSDGNLFDCDTAWHCDVYNSPLQIFHIKLLFYLDRLDGDSGALRVIPGTNHYQDAFATGLRRDLDNWEETAELFGVDPADIPAQVVPSTPGDLLIGDFRTIHATFDGVPRRRLFTLNYRQLEAPSTGA